VSNVAEKIVPAEVPGSPTALTPMTMLDRAVASGASIETLERLIALRDRWDASEARKAFNEAVAAVKADIKPVVKNRTGHNSKRYADFSAIASAVDPLLAKHGLGYRFLTEQDQSIKVTCILFHRNGHSEQTTLAGPADTSGNKNAIQAIGSTLTYLQRYSLVQMLGIAVSDDDDGAAGGASEKLSAEDAQNLRDMLKAKGAPEDKFLKWAKVERIEDIPTAQYDACVTAVQNFKSKQP